MRDRNFLTMPFDYQRHLRQTCRVGSLRRKNCWPPGRRCRQNSIRQRLDGGHGWAPDCDGHPCETGEATAQRRASRVSISANEATSQPKPRAASGFADGGGESLPPAQRVPPDQLALLTTAIHRYPCATTEDLLREWIIWPMRQFVAPLAVLLWRQSSQQRLPASRSYWPLQ